MMPSHFKTAAGRGFNFALRSSGIMTVGPVTTNNPPMIKATSRLSPARKCANNEPRIHAIKAPSVMMRKTDFETP